MPLKIAEIPLLTTTLVAAALFGSALLFGKTLLLHRSLLLHRNWPLLLRSPLLRGLSSRGSGPAGWNVPTADAALAALIPMVASAPLSAVSLPKARN